MTRTDLAKLIEAWADDLPVNDCSYGAMGVDIGSRAIAELVDRILEHGDVDGLRKKLMVTREALEHIKRISAGTVWEIAHRALVE